MEDLNLGTDYVYDGYWWTVERPSKCPGKLALSPEKIELAIYSDVLDFDYYSQYVSEAHGFIFGETIEGIKFTLFNSFTVNSSRYLKNNTDSVGFRISIISNRCVAGVHISDLSEVMDYDIYIGFNNLEDWFRYIPYRHFSEIRDDKLIEKVEWDSHRILIDDYIPSLNARMLSFHPADITIGSSKSLRSSCRAFLILKSGHNLSLQDIIEYSYEITRLWSLLCGLFIYPAYISLKRSDNYNGPQIDSALNIYVPIGEDHQTDTLHPGCFTTHYEEIKTSIVAIIDTWFRTASDSRALRNLFFRSLRSHRKFRYDLVQFLNYISVLEIYARSHDIKTVIPKHEAKKLREKLEIIIRESVTKDVQDLLVAKLAHLHAPTLRDSLNGIAASLSESTRDRLPILRTDVVPKLVSTRNYYTHYDDGINNKNKIIADDDLTGCIDQLAILIVLLLLRDLGLDEVDVLAKIQDSWRNRRMQ